MSTIVSTQPASGKKGSPFGFLKKISLRTWLIGGFVVLFLIWFIPRLQTFAKIAGLLGLAAALAFLAPILLPMIVALLGSLAAAVGAAIVAVKKSIANGDEETESQKIGEDAKAAVENNAHQQGWEGEEKKQRDKIGDEENKIQDEDDEVQADEVATNDNNAMNDGKVNPDPIDG